MKSKYSFPTFRFIYFARRDRLFIRSMNISAMNLFGVSFPHKYFVGGLISSNRAAIISIFGVRIRNDLLQSTRITLAPTPRSLEKQRHQFAENCRISREPSRLFIFSHRDLYLLRRQFCESHPRILPDFSWSAGLTAPKFARFLRSSVSSVKSDCDKKREEKKRGQRGKCSQRGRW